jgi:hypothetical protein
MEINGQSYAATASNSEEIVPGTHDRYREKFLAASANGSLEMPRLLGS